MMNWRNRRAKGDLSTGSRKMSQSSIGHFSSIPMQLQQLIEKHENEFRPMLEAGIPFF